MCCSLFIFYQLLLSYLFLAGKIVLLSSARFCRVAVGHCLICGCREVAIINIWLISGTDFSSSYKNTLIIRPSYEQLACIHVTVISDASKGLDACLPAGIDEICRPLRFFEVNRRGVQKTFHKARSFAPDVLFKTCRTLTDFTRDCL
uniref:Putative secreted protein n=1 Tax=Rhipicephalus microplus TaxID=6941 RepID=A0A6G5A3E5_RHIMP